MTELSIIIPAYNEESVIVEALKEISNTLTGRDYQILVVDDGSTDKTAKLVKGIDMKRVKLIQLEKNKGKGAAIRKGVMQAKGELILFTDADQSTSIDHLFLFLEEIETCDIVIGSRTLPKSKISKKQPLYKHILGKLGNLVIRLTLKLPYTDTQCGFKLFKRKAAKEIFNKLSFEGWSFDFEVLKIADKKGYKVKEIPVTWENNPDTAVKLSDYLETLKSLFLIKKRHDS